MRVAVRMVLGFGRLGAAVPGEVWGGPGFKPAVVAALLVTQISER